MPAMQWVEGPLAGGAPCVLPSVGGGFEPMG